MDKNIIKENIFNLDLKNNFFYIKDIVFKNSFIIIYDILISCLYLINNHDLSIKQLTLKPGINEFLIYNDYILLIYPNGDVLKIKDFNFVS